MYHNDNSPGYVKMAPGTQIPRHYAKPADFVLDLTFMETNDIYLSSETLVNTQLKACLKIRETPTGINICGMRALLDLLVQCH